ncbi:electron transfer flavoprotein subunit beta/FixA family protein [Brenneria goodwinii]|uniref:electron transfer flavoprotein subunit beta/FixA family protein n=1 Tax=Brenneria goodwinii TaxID=1109412 RepID=UPI0036E881BD
MKIIVAIKSVIDPNIRVKIKHDGTGIDSLHSKNVIDPFCEVALEEAIRMKESGIAREVIVVCVGPNECDEQIRYSIALGADRGIRIDGQKNLDPLYIAKALRSIVEIEKPGLVILGKQSVDMDNGQTGQILATLLNYAQGSVVSKIDKVEGGHIEVQREVDQGVRVVSLPLPAVITVDLKINEPRHASLNNIIKSKKSIISIYTLEQLSIFPKEHTQVISVTLPPRRPSCILLKDTKQLIALLKKEVIHL